MPYVVNCYTALYCPITSDSILSFCPAKIMIKRFDEAITVLKEAISFNPERGVFLKLNLVNLYFNTGEFEKAITEANSINILLSNILICRLCLFSIRITGMPHLLFSENIAEKRTSDQRSENADGDFTGKHCSCNRICR